MKRLVSISIGTLILSLLFSITVLYQPTKTAQAATSGGYTSAAQSFYISLSASNLDSWMSGAGTYYGCTVASYEPASEMVNFNFGSQTWSPTGWGTYDLGGQPLTDNQIITGVEDYINAWYSYCSTGNSGHSLNVMVNVNNSGGNFSTVVNTYGAGNNWADVVNTLNQWSYNTYGSLTYGSDDFEPDWSTESDVDTWINQYTAVADYASFLGFGGSADGCYGNESVMYYYPSAADSGCNNGWSALGIFDIMDANGYGFVEPQQYNQSVNNVTISNTGQVVQLQPQAVQYANILNYGYQVRGYLPMLDVTMTQYLACQQTGTCSGTDNTPPTAWDYMYLALADGDNYVAVDDIENGMWVYNAGTDMGWTN